MGSQGFLGTLRRQPSVTEKDSLILAPSNATSESWATLGCTGGLLRSFMLFRMANNISLMSEEQQDVVNINTHRGKSQPAHFSVCNSGIGMDAERYIAEHPGGDFER